MNKAAIYHKPDSNYCFPLTAHRLVLRLRVSRRDSFRAVSVLYNSKYLIQSDRLEQEMVRAYDDGTYAYYETTLELADTRVAYVFRFTDAAGKTCYFSEDGVTKTYDFALSYYNFFQFPFINPVDLMPVPDWTRSAVFYQIFVDRFAMGSQTKDRSYLTLKWGDIPNNHDFAGGDLAGITGKLDYLQRLGVNALYLTPIFLSPSYHKYDTVDYYRIDPQFGTEADLGALVAQVHRRGMHIVLDGVFNHCAAGFAPFADAVAKGRDSEYFDWFIVKGDRIDTTRPNYEMFAFCRDMPKLNTSNPAVRDFVCGVGRYYVAKFGIDGWRLDVSDEVSHRLWREFRIAVKTANPQAIVLGENWHDSYPFLQGDQFDGVMNYAFTKACLDYFTGRQKSAAHIAARLSGLLMRSKDPANDMMLNLLDSHDTHRFFSEVAGDKNRLLAALALLVCFRGMPCIYYGTEIPLAGDYDPDSRRCFPWDRLDEKDPYFGLVAKLLALRKLAPFGRGRIGLAVRDGLLVLTRKYGDETGWLFVNMTGTAKPLPLGKTVVVANRIRDGGILPSGFAVGYDAGRKEK